MAICAGILIAGLLSESFATTYYVKSNGNDTLAGTSDATAWKTIPKVNTITYQPGDQICFKRDNGWNTYGNDNCLHPGGNGTSSARITVKDYGSGNKPNLNPNNYVSGYGALVFDKNGWTFQNIQFTTSYCGLWAVANNATRNHLYINNCHFLNCYYSLDPLYSTGLTISGAEGWYDVTVDQNTADYCTFAFSVGHGTGNGITSANVHFNSSDNGKAGCLFFSRLDSGSAQGNTCYRAYGHSTLTHGVAGGHIMNSPAYFIKYYNVRNVTRGGGCPDGVGFDFEGGCNGTILHTCTFSHTAGPGIMVYGNPDWGDNTNLVLTDTIIANAAENPPSAVSDYCFFVYDPGNGGTVNRGTWYKDDASGHRNVYALPAYGWTYNGTSFQN